MAFPTSINDQITDSVTQVNTQVLGDSPAVSGANLIVSTSQALSNSAHNATAAQLQSYVTSQASTTSAVATLLAIDTASAGRAVNAIDSAGQSGLT